jgi:hypothetical protein
MKSITIMAIALTTADAAIIPKPPVWSLLRIVAVSIVTWGVGVGVAVTD